MKVFLGGSVIFVLNLYSVFAGPIIFTAFGKSSEGNCQKNIIRHINSGLVVEEGKDHHLVLSKQSGFTSQIWCITPLSPFVYEISNLKSSLAWSTESGSFHNGTKLITRVFNGPREEWVIADNSINNLDNTSYIVDVPRHPAKLGDVLVLNFAKYKPIAYFQFEDVPSMKLP